MRMFILLLSIPMVILSQSLYRSTGAKDTVNGDYVFLLLSPILPVGFTIISEPAGRFTAGIGEMIVLSTGKIESGKIRAVPRIGIGVCCQYSENVMLGGLLLLERVCFVGAWDFKRRKSVIGIGINVDIIPQVSIIELWRRKLP